MTDSTVYCQAVHSIAAHKAAAMCTHRIVPSVRSRIGARASTSPVHCNMIARPNPPSHFPGGGDLFMDDLESVCGGESKVAQRETAVTGFLICQGICPSA
jgi:hypothetical protein